MTRFPPEVMTRIIDFLKPKPDPRNCLDTWTSLWIMCRDRGIATTGAKIDLIHRLLQDGCYARRPFWDKPSRAKFWGMNTACPRPLLTFYSHLHDEETWTAMSKVICDEAVAWQDKYYEGQPIDKRALDKFVTEAWAPIAVAAAYHDRYLHAMKKATTDPQYFSLPNDLVPKHYNGYIAFRACEELLECRRICNGEPS